MPKTTGRQSPATGRLSADADSCTDLTFEQVLHLYNTMLFRVAYARAQSRTDAEDIVQETWLRYLRHAPRLDSEEHRKAWLLKVCINCANSLLSSAWRKHLAELDETMPADPPPEDYSEVGEAVRSLPEKYRTVVHLFYFEDLSVKQIAKIVGSGESAVKTQLFRAREMLKSKLGGGYSDL